MLDAAWPTRLVARLERLLRVEMIGNVEGSGFGPFVADVTRWQRFSIEHLLFANR
jgi:hypothetical protein